MSNRQSARGSHGEAAPEGNISALAEQAEREMSAELDQVVITKSVLYTLGEIDPHNPKNALPRGRRLMGDDPRLLAMPKEPTLVDFFQRRFGPAAHLLQSARLAMRSGCDEKIVLACLLHDIAVIGFIRPDHGYWGAQLVEPYVDPEVAWAIRMHQALRFYPDESVGYAYPQMYVDLFGAEYEPPAYIKAEYERARKHRWYMSARLITLNDLYAFDPSVECTIDEFTDVIGRHFHQPPEGLGFDTSPAAHMWRTIIWPTKAL